MSHEPPISVELANEALNALGGSVKCAKDPLPLRFSEPNGEASESILTEAERIIRGSRRDSYGPAEQSFGRIACMWSVLLGTPVTGRQVAHCMIALKLVRDSACSGRDNLVDIAGYAGLAEKL